MMKKARTAGIDYWIREDAWGNGYTTEASRKILNFAFDTLNINRIESCGGKRQSRNIQSNGKDWP